ncbi:T9SS type A sorting domain-containing protein [Algibacter sp. 2305UL17-15]|uniref:T9SS type A sorting domain-containing protein n=1 Tax=Algibacter sp. 2305UL17-15 TaxID=3231268 RepID=UPI003458DDB1
MRNSTRVSLLFVALICLIANMKLQGQMLLNEVPLKKQIEKSSLIIEGKVVSKKSTWDTNKKMIYTINTIEVYKVFKGQPRATIDVITSGGIVGLEAIMKHPNLELRKDDVGVFMLSGSTAVLPEVGKTSTMQFKTIGTSQGYYKYNLRKNLAANSFNKRSGISNNFYNEIVKYTKRNYQVVKGFDVENKIAKGVSSKGLLVPGPITLSDNVVTAGTKFELTITGTDFGGTQGKVWFSDANDGGSTFISALDSQVKSWSSTEIVVEVPSRAGTGPIYIEDSVGGQSPESSTLTVSYAEINAEFDIDDASGSGGVNGPEPIRAYQIQHISSNVDMGVNKGYEWEMYQDFFDGTDVSGAKAAFERAFNQWVCETGIYWAISDTPSMVDVADFENRSVPSPGTPDPPVNIIRFDNDDAIPDNGDDELDSDTLGECTYYSKGCFVGGELFWYVAELDIVFNDDYSWYTGTGIPSTSEYDLETIALHELGHGHLLGHVIDLNNNAIDPGTNRIINNVEDVMHYATSNGEAQRVLTANNSTCGNGIQTRSKASATCGQPLMADRPCPLSSEEETLNKGVSMYPNPARSKFQIKNESSIAIEKAIIYDISGRLISSHNFSNTSRTHTIGIEGISKGLYFVNIHSEDAFITKKLILE